jgi:hypothetical protein
MICKQNCRDGHINDKLIEKDTPYL